jgi:soluble lytic murein transglycosylase
MKATDILQRLVRAVQESPSSAKGLAAAAAVATAVGAAAGFALPWLLMGAAPAGEAMTNYAAREEPAPRPNREAKDARIQEAPKSAGETIVRGAASTVNAARGAESTAGATDGAQVKARLAPRPPARAESAAPRPMTVAAAAASIPAPAPAPAPAAKTAAKTTAKTPPPAPEDAPPPSAGPATVAAVAESEQKLAALVPPAPPRRPPRMERRTAPPPPANPKEIAEALAPVMARETSAKDLKLLEETARLLRKTDYGGARALYSRLTNKTARKLAYWYYLKSANVNASPSEIASFCDANPMWPSRKALNKRAERALVLRSASWRETLEYFRGRQPTSGPGKAALGAALLARGDRDRGARLLREAWRQHVLDAELEAALLSRFSNILTNADHRHRADFLSFKSKRSTIAAVKRFQSASGGRGARGAARSPTRLLARIRQLRKRDKHRQAWALLRGAPRDAGGSPSDWWVERRIQARNALNAGHPRIAYSIALGHGPLNSGAQAEAGFLAGWIALRFLNDPATARQHLAGAAHAGGSPRTLARSYYWLARAEMALSRKQDARAHFSEAARHQHTFYGQLARTALTAVGAGPQSLRVRLRPPARPTREDIRAFQHMDVIDAMLIAHKAGLDSIIPLFLNDLGRRVESPGLLTLVAEFGQRVAYPHVNVRFAKVALNRGFPLEHYAYPAALPRFRPLVQNTPLDRALLHALTRQESEFNAKIVSSANARGLMQLLPGTARQMCRAYGVQYDLKKLTKDPGYNVSLGSAYLYKVLDDYSGSYIMALASYNAGPGRVKEWIGIFGDPRDPKVDPIDWVERIPFTETRNYVHKILESVQLYRARLGGREGPLLLVDDLYRGRPNPMRAAGRGR